MRYLVAAIAALLLAGCAAAPQPMEAHGRGRVVIGAATLATLGTFEWHAAPAYTQLALLRQRAARRLNDGRITVDLARRIQTAADAARAELDEAVGAHGKSPEMSELAQRSLQRAGVLIQEAAFLLEGVNR